MADYPVDWARYALHLFTAFLLSVLYFVFFTVAWEQLFAFVIFAFAGNLAPNLDQYLRIGHRNPLMHSFIIPFIAWLVVPGSLLLTAFTLGFAAHLLNDTAKSKQYWVIVNERIGVLLLWASVLILGAIVFGWNPIMVMNG